LGTFVLNKISTTGDFGDGSRVTVVQKETSQVDMPFGRFGLLYSKNVQSIRNSFISSNSLFRHNNVSPNLSRSVRNRDVAVKNNQFVCISGISLSPRSLRGPFSSERGLKTSDTCYRTGMDKKYTSRIRDVESIDDVIGQHV
jgi:hypothetical protein